MRNTKLASLAPLPTLRSRLSPFSRAGKGAGGLAASIAAVSRHLRVPGTDEPLVPYPEQVRGARALLRGAVAEMATGEGKTITAALAAPVWARAGPVHIATANAYLAERDAALLAPVYADLGLSTGVITPETPAAERRRQYERDIVYSTLAELGFDYLRDWLVTRAADRVQVRGLGSLIVDEADLLLIDEARTPLVIAREAAEAPAVDLPALARHIVELTRMQAERVAQKLERLRALPPSSFDAAVLAAQARRGAPRDPAVLSYFREHPHALRLAERTERELRGRAGWMLDDGLLYSIEERSRMAYFTEEGQAVLETWLGPVFADAAAHGEMLAALHNLVLAFALFERDRDYLVRDNRVVLIEEATGRAAESRRYMHGLHTAIEVKELGIPLEDTETLAQISVQQFVRLYRRRAGMTGTARAAAREFARIYEMDVVPIPRHRPNRRVDLPSRLYRTAAEVDRAVVREIAAAHQRGQPVLVGTRDVARSERLSALLWEMGLPHALLNAREHAREAEIVAEAGRFGAITIATNMAGRGTDIRLEPGLADRLVCRAVELLRARAATGHTIVECASPHAFERLRAALTAAGLETTTLHEGHRLVVRAHSSRQPAARQHLAPSSGSFPCPSPVRGVRGGTMHGALGWEGAPSGADPMLSRAREATPRTFPPRAHSWVWGVSPHPTFPFGLGLYVIAVEAQPSRRLDDQLRGRSGRQGDEGITRLFASLDDETLRFYGDTRVRARALGTLARQPFLEGRVARRVLHDAQRRAERMHAGQRTVLYQFDRVLEAQRRAMLTAYDRVLTEPQPAAAVRAFLPAVAAHERSRRPASPDAWPLWLADLGRRYGLPSQAAEVGRAGAVPSPQELTAARLEELLAARWAKSSAEAGDRWPALCRAALLRSAALLWARHVEMIDHLQRQAPITFGFLPTPAVVNFAKEASARYGEYRIAVQAETLSTLLSLAMLYERPLPLDTEPQLSAAAVQTLRVIQRSSDHSPLPDHG